MDPCIAFVWFIRLCLCVLCARAFVEGGVATSMAQNRFLIALADAYVIQQRKMLKDKEVNRPLDKQQKAKQ